MMGISTAKIFVLGTLIEALVTVVFLPSANQSFLWYFINFLVTQALCLLAYRIFLYPTYFSSFRHLPSPPNRSLILGHGMAEFKMPRGEEYLRFIKETPNQGIIHLYGFLNSEQLLLTSPEVLSEVLIHKAYDFEKPDGDRNFLSRILGQGLITAQGEVHKQQRKQMTPSFSTKHIRSLYPIFWEKSLLLTRVLVDRLKDNDETREKYGTGEINIGKWAQRVSLDIVGKAGLGWDIDTLTNPDHKLAAGFEQIFAPSLENAVLFALSVYGPEWMLDFIPGGISKRFLTATGDVRRVCRDFIQKKRKDIQNSLSPSDILEHLLGLRNVSEDFLVDHTLTFLTAGHETVSIALTWAIYLLAKHPKVQSSLRKELVDSLPGGNIETIGASPSLSTLLDSLPLLNGVCNETIRLYPSAPVAVRVSIRDTSLMGQQVPRGTRMILAPWAINRSPDIWGSRAETFVPERWIDPTTMKPNTAGGTTSNYSLLTFLHGPRNCIGQGFAKGELRALVAVFVRVFEVSMIKPDDVFFPGGSLSAKPSHEMRLRLNLVAQDLIQ